MSLPNIILGSQEVERIDGTKVRMDVEIKPTAMEFVEALAKKHPTWTFTPESVSRDYENVEHPNGRIYSQVSKLWAYEFSVMQGKDLLGRIGTEYWGGQKYFVTNDRIRKQRERGSVTRTGDLKKAIKLVDKTFFAKTDLEVVLELTNKGKDLLGNYRYRKQSAFHDLWRNMQDNALAFINDNLEEFRAFTTMTQPVTGLEKFEQLRDERIASRTLENAYANGEASMVTMMGDKFFFTFKGTPAVAYNRDEVPASIKAKVGMLKLVADGEAVEDVGFRCMEDVYVINMLPNIVRQGDQK
jgi:hypothetical protein